MQATASAEWSKLQLAFNTSCFTNTNSAAIALELVTKQSTRAKGL